MAAKSKRYCKISLLPDSTHWHSCPPLICRIRGPILDGPLASLFFGPVFLQSCQLAERLT